MSKVVMKLDAFVVSCQASGIALVHAPIGVAYDSQSTASHWVFNNRRMQMSGSSDICQV
jgi:hypothetical protein